MENAGMVGDAEQIPDHIRIQLLEAGQSRHETRFDKQDKEIDTLKLGYARLSTKVSIYAGVGAVVGGCVAALVIQKFNTATQVGIELLHTFFGV